MKSSFTLEKMKRHLTYHGWKYLLAAALLWFAIDMLFTVTAYRSPEEKKVELYVYGYMDEAGMKDYMDTIHREELAEMEIVSAETFLPDETYGDMVIQVRMMAHEGDVYILPGESFSSYCGTGFFVPLQNDSEIMSLIDEKNMEVRNGWRTVVDEDKQGNTATASHLYGIPISQLPSLQRYIYVQDGYVCISIVSGNEENVKTFFRRFIKDMSEPFDAAEYELTAIEN